MLSFVAVPPLGVVAVVVVDDVDVGLAWIKVNLAVTLVGITVNLVVNLVVNLGASLALNLASMFALMVTTLVMVSDAAVSIARVVWVAV